MLKEAISYVKKQKSVIPLRKDKRPYLTEWREFQGRIATEEEVKEWWNKWPDANIGIVTGEISGLTVIDVDVRSGGKVDGLPMTLVAKTGNGGWHYYYQYEPGLTVGAGIRQGVDLRGDGGYVVAPPSKTEYLGKNGEKLGGEYEWSILEEPAPFPKDLFPELEKKDIDWQSVLKGVPAGQRNMTTASLAGKLVSSFKQSEWETIAWPILRLWNLNNQPPDDEKTVRRTFESVVKKHLSGLKPNEEIKIVTIKEAAELQGEADLIPCGVNFLDEPMGGGLSVGSSVIIAALSGHGKTAMMVSISKYLSDTGCPILWFTYEEQISAIWKRFKDAGIKDEVPAFCPIDLVDNKLDFIENAIKEFKKKQDFFAVFIDQLSFLAPKVDQKTAVDKIQGNYSMYLGLISQQIKNIAMEQKIIIFLAHQLGRSGEVAYSDMIKHAPDKVIYIERIKAEEGADDEFIDVSKLTFKKNRPIGTRPIIYLTVKDGVFVQTEKPITMAEIQSEFGGKTKKIPWPNNY